MILSTMHSHTKYCDGKNSAFEMADEAYKKGFVSFGFSGHSPLPYENDYAMSQDNLTKYIASVNAVKEVFSDKLDILLGLEWDFDTPTLSKNYDFLIGSVHQLHKNGEVFYIDCSPEGFEKLLLSYGDTFKVIEEYYQLVLESAKRPGVDIVGHLDLITKYNEDNRYFDSNSQKHKDLALNTVSEILKHNPEIIFEMNTGAMSRGYRTTPYMADFIVKYLAEKGGNIMINSDTHSTETLDFGYDLTAKILKDNGVKSTVIFKKDKKLKKIEL